MTRTSPARPAPREILRDPVHFLAFGAGSGLLPRAPGTWGSLLAVLAGWLLPGWPLVLDLAIVAVLFVAGIVICGASSRRLGLHDHPGIVLDEIVAMLFVLAFTPHAPAWYAVAFLLFRLFDVWKPWPIRELDHRLAGGAGIMLDDGLAGVFAIVVILLLERMTLPF